jgi:putative glutathione S-transferase
MGYLQDGRWVDQWYDTAKTGGAFQRDAARWRNWVTPDGSAGPTGRGGFAPDSGRYHLYVSYACPWAHRTLIFRALKDLTKHIDLSVVHPDMLGQGWEFRTDFPGTTGDSLHDAPAIHAIYTRADPRAHGRATVPILWDKAQDTIVSNESADIIRMFNSAFDALTGNSADFYPQPLRPQIDALNTRIYDGLNNGVYRAGFATTQSAYDEAVRSVFDMLDWLETHLARHRYLAGETLTEADWRLFTTLVRFDSVYHLHFKCNRARIVDYPQVWAYTRALYQRPGIAPTVHMDHIVRHYHYSHDTINPNRIQPINPVLDFMAPHDR